MASKVLVDDSPFMPPSIQAELTTSSKRGVSEDVLGKLDTWVIKKHPDRYEVYIPAEVVYRFIDEMSDRVNRGLRVSEKAVRKAEESRAETVEEHDHMTDVDKVISDLRDDYRGHAPTGRARLPRGLRPPDPRTGTGRRRRHGGPGHHQLGRRLRPAESPGPDLPAALSESSRRRRSERIREIDCDVAVFDRGH